MHILPQNLLSCTKSAAYLQSLAPIPSTTEGDTSPRQRQPPNILICGTPGTGKTSLSTELSQRTNIRHIEIGKYAREHDLVLDYDEEFQTHVIDEDKVIDLIEEEVDDNNEPLVASGGLLLDYHGCDFVPPEWLDAVVVLRTDNTTLYDRLEARGYGEAKLRENIECEIMQVIQDEAQEAFEDVPVRMYQSDTLEDFNRNVGYLQTFIQGGELPPSDPQY